MEAREQAANVARNIEYLINEARLAGGPEWFRVRLTPDEGRIWLEFPSWKAMPLPKEPPERYRPERWGSAAATTEREDPAAPLVTRWSWEPDDGHHPGDAVPLTRELLRFNRETVTFVETKSVVGGRDPAADRATGLHTRITDDITALLVIEEDAGFGNWGNVQYDRQAMRPNIIYPNGVARCSAALHRSANLTVQEGWLEDDEARGPCIERRLETRVIVRTPQNRNRMRHAHLSGLNENTERLAVSAGKRMIREWIELRQREGYCYSHGIQAPDTKHPGMLVLFHAPHRAYGDRGRTVARYPVRIAQDCTLDPTIESSLAHALTNGTKFTLGEWHRDDIGVTIRPESITVKRTDGREQQVDLYAGSYDADDGRPVDAPWVVRAQSTKAEIEITDDAGNRDRISVEIPLLATRRPATGGITLVITDEGRQKLTRQDIYTFIGQHPQGWRENADAQVDLALQDRTTAFINETRRMLDKYRPISGPPDEEVEIIADASGYQIRRRGQWDREK